MKTVNAPNDGRLVILNEHLALQPNTKVKVLVPDPGEEVALSDDFGRLAEPTFKTIWENPLDAAYDKL